MAQHHPRGLSIVKPEMFGRAFLPESWRLNLEKRMLMAGFKKEPYAYFGWFFYFLIFLMILLYFVYVLPYITGVTIRYSTGIFLIANFAYTIAYAFVFLLVSIAFAWFIFQYVIETRVFERTKEAESVLEDYLRYLSENLRGGMSFDKSLWASVRPEFGVLAEEMELVAKKTMTGTPLEKALVEFTEKYDSPMIKRSFDIISEAIKGGGKISEIIDDLVENLSNLKELKAELITTNLSYTIFINAVVIVITPFLFALSTQFILVLNRIGERIGGSLQQGTPTGFTTLGAFNFSGAALGIEPFRFFAMGVLAVNSIGAAILTSIINKGDWRHGGSKYIVYPLIAISIYLTITYFASRIFDSVVSL